MRRYVLLIRWYPRGGGCDGMQLVLDPYGDKRVRRARRFSDDGSRVQSGHVAVEMPRAVIVGGRHGDVATARAAVQTMLHARSRIADAREWTHG